MSRINMSYASERQSALANMATLGPKLLIETVKSMSGFLEQAIETSAKLPTGISILPQQTCSVPETDCPPRCVCHITWEASHREKLSCNIKITNASDVQRLFTIKSLPFAGGTIQVNPDRITLEPGQTGYALAAYSVPENLTPGIYKTEILVTGAYEQCISITLQVNGPESCECHIVQGEIPTRTVAHHWYDHFQCVEPCFRPKRENEKR